MFLFRYIYYVLVYFTINLYKSVIIIAKELYKFIKALAVFVYQTVGTIGELLIVRPFIVIPLEKRKKRIALEKEVEKNWEQYHKDLEKVEEMSAIK